MALQWEQADDGTVTAEQDGTTWVLRRRAAPDDHPRVGPGWYLHLALEGGLTEERLPMSPDLARAKREAEAAVAYDSDNVRALLGTKVEPDESNSSRLNRISVERLRERFGDASMSDEGAAVTDLTVNASPEPPGARCSMCRHATDEHEVDPETGFRPCRSIGHPKGLTCAECRRLTSPAHVDAVMAMRDDPLLKVAFGAYLATRAHVNDQLGESAPAFFTDVHESAVASALIEYSRVSAELLELEANSIPAEETRARGIADGMRRAARRLRGER